jgi:DNA primase
MSINYRQLRASVQIEEILSWMQWEASSRVGDQLRGTCPICTAPRADTTRPDSSRTFSVNTQRNIYRCFRCGSGGNALDLWSSYRKLSLYAAADEIQNRLIENKQP